MDIDALERADTRDDEPVTTGATHLTPLPAIIRSDEEAVSAAEAYAASILPGASNRDREGKHPFAELVALRATGLLGITVPRELGGAQVSHETVTEIFRILAAADPSIAQIPQSHFGLVKVVDVLGTPEQRAFFLGEVLRGARFGNATSERGTKHRMALQTRLTRQSDGTYLLNGRKYYTTGSISAQWIPVYALNNSDEVVIAYVRRDAEGLEVDDDWSAIGQRATTSGTVTLRDVIARDEEIFPFWGAGKWPDLIGPFANLLNAAIDVGIAENALTDAIDFVRTRSRPWAPAGIEHASADPLLLQRIGELTAKLHAAQELLLKAGRTIDRAEQNLTAAGAAEAAISVAEAKAFGGDVGVEIANELFALAGTSAADSKYNLDRHWRNVRIHTLHDPNRWKYHEIGDFIVNGRPSAV